MDVDDEAKKQKIAKQLRLQKLAAAKARREQEDRELIAAGKGTFSLISYRVQS